MNHILLNNVAPVFGLCFLALICVRSKVLDNRRRRLLCAALILEFIEVVIANAELELGALAYHSMWRDLTSAIGYTTRPTILMFLVLMAVPRKRPRYQNVLLYAPAIIAMVLGFSVYFTDVVYSFSPDNKFTRGPLGYFPIFCVFVYLVLLVVMPRQKELRPYFDNWLVVFIAIFIGFSMIAEGFLDSENMGRTATIYSTVFFFYIIQSCMLQKALQAERENQALKKALHDADVAREELLESQKELIAAKNEAERANAAKTQFLQRMSHDMRTPLNGILGLIEICKTHPEDRELVTENREKIEVSAKHLLSLVNDVLQTSKLKEGAVEIEHEPLDIMRMTQEIGDIVEGRAIEAGVTMVVEPNDDIAKYRYVYGSELHLKQIILNIYSNCIKYNKPAGKVFSKIQATPTNNGVTYRWEIRDTGIGMSPEFLEHIFDLFAQESSDARSTYMGTGLGMSITKNLVELMGGSITVESEQGKGSVFTVIIPFELAPEPQQSCDDDVNDASIEGLRLLLAEDNDINAEVAQLLLEDAGAHVRVVSDGQQAVDAFLSAQQGRYDAILMDLMMPVLNGIDATKAIRALDRPDAKRIPIIAMTANAFKEDAEHCIAAGMNAHLAKPLDMELVKRTLATCVAAARAQSSEDSV